MQSDGLSGLQTTAAKEALQIRVVKGQHQVQFARNLIDEAQQAGWQEQYSVTQPTSNRTSSSDVVVGPEVCTERTLNKKSKC
jgi:hypothetical protein